jgi:hypothetical protein
MKMGFYLAKRSSPGPLSERWRELDQTYFAVEQLFERLSTIYRTMPLNLAEMRFGALAADRSSAWNAWFEQSGNALSIEPPDDEAIGEMDGMRLTGALDGFVAWRAESMPRGSQARLSWTTDGGWLQLTWREQPPETFQHDDRPPAQESLSAATRALSLPFLARVIAEHRGRLTWTREPHVEARVRWPLLASSPNARVSEVAQSLSTR